MHTKLEKHFKELTNAAWIVALSYAVIGWLTTDVTYYSMSKAMNNPDYQGGNAIMYPNTAISQQCMYGWVTVGTLLPF